MSFFFQPRRLGSWFLFEASSIFLVSFSSPSACFGLHLGTLFGSVQSVLILVGLLVLFPFLSLSLFLPFPTGYTIIIVSVLAMISAYGHILQPFTIYPRMSTRRQSTGENSVEEWSSRSRALRGSIAPILGWSFAKEATSHLQIRLRGKR